MDGVPAQGPASGRGAAARPGSEGERALQQRLDTTARADRFYDEQVLDRLNPRMREFIARQEMFFLATADRRGECDSTFRAGPPGFLRVFDDRTLAYPEYRGNGVLASLGNIEENPHVGLLLVDFVRDRIGLHVNGRARLLGDAELRAERPGVPVDPVPGRRAVIWVEITVEEAYIHCSKHIPRLRRADPPRPRAAVDREGDPAGRSGRTDRGNETDGDGDRERDWGTDDHRRKGGDFFGAAAQAPQRRAERATAHHERWHQEVRRTLDRAERPDLAVGQPFTHWFG
ncbi:pyridoxamine 5'-phosphate oxidase family protein [Streptomyces sp. LX-29]|uniref:pyridoxamine 5'-phosphate oxidase family protein n=1 Tax=Streptomyces sp. LX-29 TaxID=2900152 RepID=UPI00240DBB75|nr:pyridoxamine 5'-phosphate oxidase family protein [Streptomyces sp. LX-29]WFB11674.1 pyridoxamine 5'-phosphate oxidase family protein [Streptomyces sp. LX-29]